jgi:hypothetical protein
VCVCVGLGRRFLMAVGFLESAWVGRDCAVWWCDSGWDWPKLCMVLCGGEDGEGEDSGIKVGDQSRGGFGESGVGACGC